MERAFSGILARNYSEEWAMGPVAVLGSPRVPEALPDFFGRLEGVPAGIRLRKGPQRPP